MVTSTPVLPSTAPVLVHFVPLGGVVVGDDGTATSRAAVREELARTRRPLMADLAGLDVHWHAVHGRPEAVLATASTGAELLVVGSRGRGELRELLLGSVTAAVLHSASCPVVVRDRASS